MKTITKLSVAAIALIGLSASANAQCASDRTEVPGAINDTSGPTDGTVAQEVPAGSDCFGVRTGSSNNDGFVASNRIVVDPVTGDAEYSRARSEVFGQNSTAVGNGSQVGEKFTNPGPDGILGDDPLTTVDESADDFDDYRFHNHSTAIGADAKTDRSNQVVLGTEDDDVTVRSLPGNVSNARSVVVHEADGTLSSDGGQIYGTLDNHENRIGSLENGVSGNAAAIASNSDAIAANSAAINENSEGVAIAMAMPDSWLSDQENFAIAGGFGGFNGETAFGAIGTARIYGGFSAYAGGGISTSGNEWGWKVGARAGF